jgi:hypothetical protein
MWTDHVSASTVSTGSTVSGARPASLRAPFSRLRNCAALASVAATAGRARLTWPTPTTTTTSATNATCAT